ncbi:MULTISPECIES: hypothetical protein [Haloarcula]|uniref:Uncharacterized protein n=3 Tax=Haloarcula TaxID=2237 RepID=A0A830FQE2_HALAR|nr:MULTISPECIES: hypothetical protein [Haloarcula]MDS0253874.1 hypothetical protein [Haloarcula argentinensis]GGK75574.1 hypothetical protein GCM10009067_29980 [Haloarcula sebkhae]GGM46041.1 hypothetical protein GCM10009006_29160 [Haloarcula argentinensis]
MGMVTVNDVDSLSYRAVEVLLLLPTLLFGFLGLGVILVGLGGESVGDGPLGMASIFGTFGVWYIGGIVVALISWLVTPIVLYFDTKKIRDADVDWDPNPVLYAVGGFFLGYLMKLHHLYHRHQYVVDWVDRDWWWTVVAVGTVLPPVCIALGATLVSSGSLGIGFVLVGVGILTAVPFSVAIYRDATYVRLQSGAWQPNPGNYVNLGVFFLLLGPIVYPIIGCYYLFRRHRAIGTL